MIVWATARADGFYCGRRKLLVLSRLDRKYSWEVNDYPVSHEITSSMCIIYKMKLRCFHWIIWKLSFQYGYIFTPRRILWTLMTFPCHKYLLHVPNDEYRMENRLFDREIRFIQFNVSICDQFYPCGTRDTSNTLIQYHNWRCPRHQYPCWHCWHNRHICLKPGYVSDSKVHGANMGPMWCRQDPGGPHVGPMNFAIWDLYQIDILR